MLAYGELLEKADIRMDADVVWSVAFLGRNRPPAMTVLRLN